MSDALAYQANDPSRARASLNPLRERLIEAGLLKPSREDGLLVCHVPRWWPVLRMTALDRKRAEREALS